MEVQTQAFDAQGNLITPAIDDKKVEESVKSPSRTRRAASPTDDKEALIASDKDPLALKLESALKRSIADRTGNIQLKQEAAREQSLADKMGARAVLSKEQIERTKKEAEQLRIDAAQKQSQADRSRDAALKKEAAAQQHLADKLIASANKSLAALAAAENNTAVPTPATPTPAPTIDPAQLQDAPLIVQVLQDALKALLESAAQKQSQADRTGDLKLKQEAALAQSKVDKMRAQLAKELQSRQPTQATTPAQPVAASSPQLQPAQERSPQVERYTPPPARVSPQQQRPQLARPQQKTQVTRQRSPQLQQFSFSSNTQRNQQSTNVTVPDKPVSRASNDRNWRVRPDSPVISSNENSKPNNNIVSSSVVNTKVSPTKVKVDATTNCSEEEFEQA